MADPLGTEGELRTTPVRHPGGPPCPVPRSPPLPRRPSCSPLAAARTTARPTRPPRTKTATDATTEDGAATDAEGDVTGTVTSAETGDDGATALTVDTGDGEVELTTSSAAYVEATTDSGGRQRTRLSTWLQSSDFGDGEYTFVERNGQITDIVEN